MDNLPVAKYVRATLPSTCVQRCQVHVCNVAKYVRANGTKTEDATATTKRPVHISKKHLAVRCGRIPAQYTIT
jgi:hypothetical protein